ncbi:NUDIX hydrolase [Brevibacillus borstelensis]
MLKYTMCFLRCNNQLLMLNRQRPPGMGSWTGVGGKIELGETPYISILREIYEETGIKAIDARFTGIVTWYKENLSHSGMYTFIVDVDESLRYETPRSTDEGILDWKDIPWLISPHNTGVVRHVHYLLPVILSDRKCYEHRFHFNNDDDVFDHELIPLHDYSFIHNKHF